MTTRQAGMFDELPPTTAIPAQQQRLFAMSQSIEQWRQKTLEALAKDFTSQKANAIGFGGELTLLGALYPIARIGGWVETQYPIAKDTIADFFITCLPAYPNGIAIEVRDHTGPGSHSKKLPDTAITYVRKRIPLRIVVLGDYLPDAVKDNLNFVCNSYQDIKWHKFDKFLQWAADMGRGKPR